MKTQMLAENILKNKTPESSEIELHLFEFCNLSCQFCGQDHDSVAGMDSIIDKALRVNTFIQESFKNHHIVNIMGGEIFNDLVKDKLFEDYLELVIKINVFAKGQNNTCVFNWVTNLVFDKHDRVSRLLQSLDEQGIESNISTSYDLSGRKNRRWEEKQFLSNIERFSGKIYTVGFVLTRPAIKILLSKSDTLLDYLYERYPVYFDYYVPEKSANVLMPSDQDLLDAFIFLADHYPKINPISDLLENKPNKMTCYSLNKLTLLPDGKEVKCRYLKYKSTDFKTPIDYNSNENIILAHLEKNECLSCEWFSRCSFRCFVQADWAARKQLSKCFLKSFFEHVTKWN